MRARLGTYDRELAKTHGILDAVIFQRILEIREKEGSEIFFIDETSLNEEFPLDVASYSIQTLLDCSLIEEVFEDHYRIVDSEKYPFKKKDPSKNKKMVSSEEYRFIKELVQSKDSPFKKHRLNEDNPTKLVKTVYGYLIALENGTFLNNLSSFSDSYGEKLEIFKKPLFREDMEELVSKAVKGLKTRQNKQFYPLNKDSVTNISLDSFFYNPMTGNSWFLECALNEPQVLSSIIAEKALDDVPSEFSEVLKKSFDYDSLSDSERKKFSYMVKNLYLSYKDLANRYENIYTNTNWLSYYSYPRGFAEQFVYYAKHYCTNANISYIGSSDFWRKFVKWAEDFHHVNLNPTFDYLMGLKKNYEAELSKKSESERIRREMEMMKERKQMRRDYEEL